MSDPLSTETVFITKYALSDGVRLAEVIERSGIYVRVEGVFSLLRDADCHSTLEAAQAAARVAADKKIASLKKQIAKLEKMQFPLKGTAR